MDHPSDHTPGEDPYLLAALRANPLIAAVSPHLSEGVWAVGGVVRDALCEAPPGPDVDLVVEGDAVAEARRVAAALGAEVTTHGRFGTAVLLLDGGHVDLVTARRETYARPGALPDVTPGTLADDLARRDFTVNAVAVRLGGDGAGAVADPHGGRADLEARVLRAVRAGEFREDPSRIVRAARYAGRLGMEVEAATRGELRLTAPDLDWASSRVAEELARLLAEAHPQPGLNMLAAWGAPGVVAHSHPSIGAIDRAAHLLGVENPPGWALRLGVTLDATALAELAVPGWAVQAAADVAAAPDVAQRVSDAFRPSHIDEVLSRTPIGTLVGLHALGDPRVAAWWEIHRGLELAVTGADLVRAGARPGPRLGEALRRVRAAVIDGEVHTPDEQMELAMSIATRDA